MGHPEANIQSGGPIGQKTVAAQEDEAEDDIVQGPCKP